MIVRGHYYLCIFILLAGLAKSTCAQANETVLYSFQGGSDGYSPVGSIVFDKAGNLYGATTYTSPCITSFQCGSVYELSPPQQPGGAWTFKTLYTFKGRSNGDGGAPTGGLVQDAYGNLYGLTGYGGTGPCVLLGTSVGCGTVYELIRPTEPGADWQEKILYSFQGNQDGQLPEGDLVFDKLGNLYGATWFGGGKGDSNTCNSLYPYCGTIFELSPSRSTSKSSAWTEKVLHSFRGVESGDGGEPNGGLIFDVAGAVYGTTVVGGYNCPHNSGKGCGTVVKLSPSKPSWNETMLYQFMGVPDGRLPNGNLIIDQMGNLYGTTVGDGNSKYPSGTVFNLVPQPGGTYQENIIYGFRDDSDGGSPEAGLIFDPRGNLYGTAASGGDAGGGTVFRILAKTGNFQALYQFQAPPDGSLPDSRLTLDPRGSLFGSTPAGGTGTACGSPRCGTVFQLTP